MNINNSLNLALLIDWVYVYDINILSAVEINKRTTLNSNIIIPHFKIIFTQSRKNSEGGGVMLGIHEKLKCERLNVKSYPSFESIYAKIWDSTNKHYKIFISVYCSPIQSKNRRKQYNLKRDQDLSDFFEQLGDVIKHTKCNIYLSGDLNC